jgi:ABC-2 type transport system permease protein
MKTYCYTIWTACLEKLRGGIPALLLSYFIRAAYILPLMILWRSLAAEGADLGGFTLAQLLTYTYLSTLLERQLNVRTPASGWLYEGLIIDLYQRPQTVFGQLTAHTMGEWLPAFAFFTLPMALLAPLFGLSLLPATLWAFLSLLLAISLGFAVDFIFASFIISMKNLTWIATMIRSAVTAIFSGAMIPFALLPWGLGSVFELLPFASLAGAPLALYVGAAPALSVIPIQIFWNLTLWPLAVLVFKATRERMVSYGG